MRAAMHMPFEIEPSYNIAPMTYQPVVRLDRDTDERELVPMCWGLVPFWARDANVSYSTINANWNSTGSTNSICSKFIP
jgi:putative SOS response-associated peptidase YedK